MFLVDVKLDVETLECHLSSKLFRGSVNSSKVLRNRQPHCEANLTDREEVGFNYHSKIVDTHYSGIGDTLLC